MIENPVFQFFGLLIPYRVPIEDTSSKALVKIDGQLLYLTQDAGYVRRRADGDLECMITGRIHGDAGGYVKVRGFRGPMGSNGVQKTEKTDKK